MYYSLNKTADTIIKKKSSVAIVGVKSAWRENTLAVLSKNGFLRVRDFNDIAQLLLYLKTEEIDWLISTAELEARVSLIDFLLTARSNRPLLRILVTPVLAQEELQIFSFMAELGSGCPLELENLTNSPVQCKMIFSEFLTTMAAEGPLLQLTNFLISSKLNLTDEEKVAVLKAAIHKEPSNLKLHLELRSRSGNVVEDDKVIGSLDNGISLDPAQAGGMKLPSERSKIPALPKDDNNSKEDKFVGYHLAWAVGSDLQVNKEFSKVSAILGIPFVVHATAAKALEEAEAGEKPDFILLDWDLMACHPAIFIQTIRALGLLTTNILVLAAQKLDLADTMLLSETGISEVLLKANIEDLHKYISRSLHPENLNMIAEASYAKISEMLGQGQVQMAFAELDKLKHIKDLPPVYRQLVNAEFAFHEEKLQLAKELAIDGLKRGASTVKCLFILGKVLIAEDCFHLGHQCLHHAQEISPLNITRLSIMIEAKISANKTDEAIKLLKEADMLARDSERVIVAWALLNLLVGNLNKAKTCLGRLKSLESVIAYLNNRAVSFTANGKYEEGIQLYSRTIEALPPIHEKYRPFLSFNLAMGYLRAGKLDIATETMQGCLAVNNPKVADKAKRVLQTISSAKQSNARMNIATPRKEAIISRSKETLKAFRSSGKYSKMNVIQHRDWLLYGLFTAKMDRNMFPEPKDIEIEFNHAQCQQTEIDKFFWY